MRLLLTLLFLAYPALADAAVTLSFYSRDFGARYPHAFILMSGTLDDTGERVEANYGWTSTSPTVTVLAGKRVTGVISSVDDDYMKKSLKDFSLVLSDDEYRAVMTRVQAWRDKPQPSYSLNQANCVFFVADIARGLGLRADPEPGLMLKPKSFLQHVRDLNQPAIAARQAQPASPPASGAPVAPPEPAPPVVAAN